MSSVKWYRMNDPTLTVALVSVALVCSCLLVNGQNSAPAPTFAKAKAITVQNGRGLAEAVEQIQQLFLTPVTFEQLPFENLKELHVVTVVRREGPKQLLVNPVSNFTVILDPNMDRTPYLAAQSILSAYRNSGGPGLYSVIQQNDRVDIVPAQLLSLDGDLRNITPIMSRRITLAPARRSLPDTVMLIANNVSSVSGIKVVPLSLPGQLFEQVELGASEESAADVIDKLGAALNRPVSFQCLYEPNEKAYYLNLKSVAPVPNAGTAPVHGPISHPKTEPLNHPLFMGTGK